MYLLVEIICRSQSCSPETCWCNFIPGFFGRVKEIILSPTRASHIFAEASNCFNALWEEEGGKTWSTSWQSSIKLKENGQNVDANVWCWMWSRLKHQLHEGRQKGFVSTLNRDVLILKVKKKLKKTKKTLPPGGFACNYELSQYSSRRLSPDVLRQWHSERSSPSGGCTLQAGDLRRCCGWHKEEMTPGTGLSAPRGSPEVCDRKKRMRMMMMTFRDDERGNSGAQGRLVVLWPYTTVLP